MIKFSLKPCVLMVASVMLSACQSTANYQNPQAVVDNQPQVFESGMILASQKAKQSFVQALSQYLNTEQYAVSVYQSRVVPLEQSDVDKDADNFWVSYLKTRSYMEDNQYPSQKPEFRTTEDYIYPSNGLGNVMGEDLSELPYLNYQDEESNRQKQTVSRLIGMSDEYQEVSVQISILADTAFFCVSGVSYKMDGLIQDDPQINKQNESVQHLQKDLVLCQNKMTKEAQSLLPKARGYQIEHLAHIQQCVLNYQKNLNDIMSKGRTPKSLSKEEGYDNYDSIYENYYQCHSTHNNQVALEPYAYINSYSSEASLQLRAKIDTCNLQYLNHQQALYAQGKTYEHDAKAFAQNYYDVVACIDAVIAEDAKIEPKQAPNSIAQAKEQRMVHEAYLLSYDIIEPKYDNHKFSDWFEAYNQLKKEDSQAKELQLDKSESFYKNFFGQLIKHLQQTPEQLQAKNLYQYNNTKITSISHADPVNKRHQILMSLDFESPTASQSIQLPMQLDFKNSNVNADVSAVLPVMAMISPENALLPDDIPNGQMSFQMPEALAKQIPAEVIYEASRQGLIAGFDSLDAQKFTPVAINHHQFAKEVKATQAIKINLDSDELGRLYANIVKFIVKDLKAYVDAHPEYYPLVDDAQDENTDGTAHRVKSLIDNFAVINTAYRASDVGGVLQIIEGLMPMSLDNVGYAYLDSKGQLAGFESISSLSTETQNMQIQTINQTRYDKTVFDEHPLASQFKQTFSQAPSFDGGGWIKDMVKKQRLQKQAQEESATIFFDELF